MKQVLCILLTLFVASACTAQPQPIPQREILPPPTISVNNLQNGESPIKVSDVKIDVKVIGAMAVTTVDMVFYNPNNRILEGELQFPLGEGQNISRFALDINGKLREGVVVEKAKGQQVFESVIRQNIDPGLLEKTQGNNFRARIYPLPAKGTRRIVIAYEQELQKENDDYRVYLPVDYGDTLKTFSLNLCVFGKDIEPKIEETPLGRFSFDKSGEAYVASYNAENYSAKGQLMFSVPNKKQQHVYVEKGKISGETVFYAQVQPNYISKYKKSPSRLAIFWDASLSMSDRNKEMEMDLLDKYFDEIGSLDVDLHVFNCISMPKENFSVKRGNWKELKKYIESLSYDGATQLGILDFKNIKTDEILLFSDGLTNFGKKMPILGNTPVTTVSSTLKADYSMLQYISSSTGGKYINLMQQTVDESIKLLQEDSYRLISAEYDKSEIADFATSNILIKPSSGFSISGKLSTKSARVKLNFGIGNEILHSQTITVVANNVSDYDNIVERMWAQKKINELDMMYEKNREEIESIGRKYNIVTRNTSLIVLDRIEDYIQHEIVPPAELLDEYNKQIGSIKQNKLDTKKRHINSVVSQFDNRKNWWNRSFPKTKPVRKKSNLNISVADVRGTDDRQGVDIAELSEHRVVVQESAPPPPRSTTRFVPPTIAHDEEVSDADEMVSMDDLAMNKMKEEKSLLPSQTAAIQLKGWNPDTPYLKILKEKTDKDLYGAYLDIRNEYKTTPSFYLDVATLFEERGLKQEALIVLSNLAELEVENYRLLRVLAHRLSQLGYTEYAIDHFETVKRLRPEEPQSYRDLALVYEQNKQYQAATDLLYQIVERQWDGRFPGIEVIAAEEMNAVIARANRENIDLSLEEIDKRLLFNMPVDVRIVLNWDTDNSDMDLWVTDPYGERCMYSNKLTRIGGMISHDFTGGYGPEEFLIKQAVDGTYKIQANYYGSREQTLIGPTTIYLDIFTRYAGGKEKKETITLRLTENKEVIDIGSVTFSTK